MLIAQSQLQRLARAALLGFAMALVACGAPRVSERDMAIPFDEALEFREFDMWHYYGRTAKHGAFMGGADFVQWHGNYELLRQRVEIDDAAAALRRAKTTPEQAH